MQKLRISFLAIITALAITGKAQDVVTIQNYINQYKDLAIAEMQRTSVPASITLAQGIHETTAGTSVLVLKSNNHFGIKCKSSWTGESVSHTDDAPNECFRKYSSSADSYKDHSDFLKMNSRYGSLFKLDPLDYKGWANGLKKAGYATNPKYPLILIKLIEDYNLQDYSLIALGEMPIKEEVIAAVVVPPVKEEIKEQKTTEIKEVEKLKQKEEVLTTVVVPPQVQTKTIIESAPVYPAGEFKINETRVVYMQKGTSFLATAQQYNVPLARIFEFNEMVETESAVKDQLIYLQRKRKTGKNEFHMVLPGETLADIAQQEAIRIESLLEYNFLKANMKPAAGEQLYLRSMAPAMPKLAVGFFAANDAIAYQQF